MKNLSFLLFLLVFTAAMPAASCSNKPEKLAAGEGFEEPDAKAGAPLAEVAQELHDVRYSQSKGDKLLWRLDAKTVEQAADGPIDLQSVEITYYGDDGRVTVLTADAGLYDDGGATLSGNVTVRTSDGGRVETASIRWDQNEQRLSGEGEVTISRGDSTIRGKGFELLATVETVKIYQVSGIIRQGDMDL